MLQLVVEELIEATIRQRYESARHWLVPGTEAEAIRGPLGDDDLFPRPASPVRGSRVGCRAKGARGRCGARKTGDATT